MDSEVTWRRQHVPLKRRNILIILRGVERLESVILYQFVSDTLFGDFFGISLRTNS
jgi:hypothetical protein